MAFARIQVVRHERPRFVAAGVVDGVEHAVVGAEIHHRGACGLAGDEGGVARVVAVEVGGVRRPDVDRRRVDDVAQEVLARGDRGAHPELPERDAFVGRISAQVSEHRLSGRRQSRRERVLLRGGQVRP